MFLGTRFMFVTSSLLKTRSLPKGGSDLSPKKNRVWRRATSSPSRVLVQSRIWWGRVAPQSLPQHVPTPLKNWPKFARVFAQIGENLVNNLTCLKLLCKHAINPPGIPAANLISRNRQLGSKFKILPMLPWDLFIFHSHPECGSIQDPSWKSPEELQVYDTPMSAVQSWKTQLQLHLKVKLWLRLSLHFDPGSATELGSWWQVLTKFHNFVTQALAVFQTKLQLRQFCAAFLEKHGSVPLSGFGKFVCYQCCEDLMMPGHWCTHCVREIHESQFCNKLGSFLNHRPINCSSGMTFNT